METKERRKERKEESGVHSTPDYLDAFQFVRSFCHIWVGYINIGRTAFVRPIISATFQTQARIVASDQDYEIQCFPRCGFFPLRTPKSKKKKKFTFY